MKKTRSILSKSRIILIFLLLLGVGAEASAYYYVQNTTSNAPSSVTTSFQTTNLNIDLYEARLNQPVTISVNVTNLGNIQTSYPISLTINDSVIETKELTFLANESKLVMFSISEANEGNYNVTINDQVGVFIVTSAPTPIPTTLSVANMFIDPLESWPGQPVNVTVDLTNTGTESISYSLPFLVNDVRATSVQVELAAGASQTVTASLNENAIGKYRATVAGKTTTFRIVETGKHTLHIISTRVGFSFTLDDTTKKTPFNELVDVGPHNIVFPDKEEIQIGGWGLVPFGFAGWNDGSRQLTRNVDVQKETYAIINYIRIVPATGSCPSLFVWNGTQYAYSAEVSDGAGWLGYLDHFQADGTMVFSYNYPVDYIKLDSSQLQAKNGFYEMKITEMSDEIFYLDQVKLVTIDHPTNTNVFSTTSTFIYNLANQGTMYTVSKNPAVPISAFNDKGQNVLPSISKLDGSFTNSTIWTWNKLTLNLGDLSNSKEIKLVVAAKITWPTTAAGGNNFMKYASQPGVTPSPPPFMEVKAQNGSWIRVPDDRQFPLPDVTDETFIVNLTGLFPTNDFELRINTYQNIQFDYIGVDTTNQQNITAKTIMPTYADLQQLDLTNSNSSGAFTRYGDVLSLLQSADDKFVIGREADTVSLQFPVDTSPVPTGMVRDYFVIASCWFKGKGLSYVPFTVDPLPFQTMTSFPYPTTESYPFDASHKAYLQTFNTRTINPP